VFRTAAEGNDAITVEQERAVGLERLVYPHEVNSRLFSNSGIKWNRFDGHPWTDTEAALYYGYDGGLLYDSPNSQINALMYNILLGAPLNVLLGSNKGLELDFFESLDNRRMFTEVEGSDQAVDPGAEPAIRRQLVKLIWQFWGKQVQVDDQLISDIYDMMVETQSEGLARIEVRRGQGLTGNALYGDPEVSQHSNTNRFNQYSNSLDQNYMMRTWSTVLIFLMTDIESIYE
jgi:hypothetical protein